MKDWKMEIDVSGFWYKGKDDSTSIEEFCKQLHEALTGYSKRVERILPRDEIYDWNELLERLEYANFDNWIEFNYWLDDFYDFLDFNDIWFKTF